MNTKIERLMAARGRCYYIRKGQTLTCSERELPINEWCDWCLG